MFQIFVKTVDKIAGGTGKPALLFGRHLRRDLHGNAWVALFRRHIRVLRVMLKQYELFSHFT